MTLTIPIRLDVRLDDLPSVSARLDCDLYVKIGEREAPFPVLVFIVISGRNPNCCTIDPILVSTIEPFGVVTISNEYSPSISPVSVSLYPIPGLLM